MYNFALTFISLLKIELIDCHFAFNTSTSKFQIFYFEICNLDFGLGKSAFKI